MRRLLLAALLLFTSQAFGATYQLTEEVDIKPQPDAKLIEVWVPIPYENPWQKIKSIKVESPFPYLLQEEEEYGNRFLYIRKEGGLKEPVRVRVEVVVERDELKPVKRASSVPLRYYLSDRLVPVEKFKKMAKKVTAGKRTAVEKLRAIYDYVVANMKYDKSGKGWGRGDAIWACDAKRGNCTDFHSLFIALSRASGIPALFEIGLPVNGDGEVKGYHCWVLAFPDGYTYGIDASEAAKHPEKREYFFGHLCDKRIGITRGRDILLNPPQHGSRLNYLYKPYEEVDLTPVDGLNVRFYLRELSP
ncbi:transglutaminase-like domain-containing protein [Phorcysia thermohydrogeniphila]|uniref:Transglutaminase superfamily protein n=1 Tax=Phorcysia thermohydrogeniphila TaxID=936138 RepID=A0A4V2PD18_9BACT|nr:transglutaminase-like domain-containing protein [Phorcysia thermohydrogeniphila]TCK03456.1 transglutaminase superfamily protein [Phorcysia thermohydrogeniphila]